MEIATHRVISKVMLSRTVLWIVVILTCLALIAVLVFVIGSLADQTGEASPLQNQSVIFEMTRSS